jgi:PPM family protein phosphatase
MAPPLQIELALITDAGGRPYNEDACGHWHSERHLCCVLADGAGGHGGGDVASRFVVAHMLAAYAQAGAHDAAGLEALLRNANRALLAQPPQGTHGGGMYTTAVLLSVDFESNTALWGHCGDSRLYAFRGGRLCARTIDHSMVQTLVDAGLLDESGTRTHPKRSELYSALGTEEQDLHVSVSAQHWPIEAGDVLMLCTDGLWEYVDDAAAETALVAAADPRAWLAGLEAAVRQATAGRSSHDNFTALAVWFAAAG